MVIIRPPFEAVKTVMGSQHISDLSACRLSHHCFYVPCETGMLLYQSLTGELLLLNADEYKELQINRELQTQLAERWFFVPQDFDENKHCDQIKSVIRLLKPSSKSLKTAIIFTTSDCNARCFYCFEMGQRRVHMSEQTAQDVADYLIKGCEKKKLSIRWFGGEPLYNDHVIDVVSERLQKAGIEYSAHMVSNGYLFNADRICRANDLWKLRYVIITLDGTEEIYNKTKAYVKCEGSAFHKVLDNIEALLMSGIYVTVNLNMDARNFTDLMRLADILSERFGGKKGFFVRTGLLKEYVGAIHAFPSTDDAINALKNLNNKLRSLHIHDRSLLENGIMLDNCMADQDSYITILPDGRIGKCGHHIDTLSVGSLRDGITDQDLVRAWKESYPPSERCQSCADYPICKRLKLCNGQPEVCDELYQECRLMQLREQVLNTYEYYLQEGINTK